MIPNWVTLSMRALAIILLMSDQERNWMTITRFDKTQSSIISRAFIKQRKLWINLKTINLKIWTKMNLTRKLNIRGTWHKVTFKLTNRQESQRLIWWGRTSRVRARYRDLVFMGRWPEYAINDLWPIWSSSKMRSKACRSGQPPRDILLSSNPPNSGRVPPIQTSQIKQL